MSRGQPDLESAPLAAEAGGVWYFTPSCTRFEAHRHRELELNLVMSGTGACAVDGERVALSAGSALWLMPGSVHGLSEVSPDFQMWVVVFGDAAVEEASRGSSGLLKMITGAYQLAELDRPALGRLARLSYERMRQRERPNTTAPLARLLCSSFRESDSASTIPAGLHRAVRRVRRLIEAQLDSTLTIEQLAADVELSASRLTHVFSAQLGMPPQHYLHHARVQRAVACLVANPEATLTRAAFDAGFGSYVQFFRAFRVVTGLSPRSYERLFAAGVIPSRTWQQNLKG